jgi:hypothetical protein
MYCFPQGVIACVIKYQQGNPAWTNAAARNKLQRLTGQSTTPPLASHWPETLPSKGQQSIFPSLHMTGPCLYHSAAWTLIEALFFKPPCYLTWSAEVLSLLGI